MLVFFPEVPELMGCVVSPDTCGTLSSQQVVPVFGNRCHYLKASHIHVPRLLDDLSAYIRDKQIGRPLVLFVYLFFVWGGGCFVLFCFEMKNNYIAREG